MSKLFLEVEDFKNRLNLNFFTNIERGVSEEQLQKAYPSEVYDIFEKASVEKWINSVYAETGGEIVKGGFNDTSEVEDKLIEMKEKIDLMKAIQVQGEGDLGIRTVYVLERALIPEKQDLLQKGEDVEDALEKEVPDSKIQKGKVDDIVNYSDLRINFKKTGKEIKEKLKTIEEIEEGKISVIKIQMAVLEDSLEYPPTEKYTSDDSDDIPLSYKHEMTYKNNNGICDNNIVEVGNEVQTSLNAEQCLGYRQWNDLAYKYRDCKRELKTISFLKNNLEDDSVLELSARQLFALGF
jgi:hypothetical protein